MKGRTYSDMLKDGFEMSCQEDDPGGREEICREFHPGIGILNRPNTYGRWRLVEIQRVTKDVKRRSDSTVGR
jgi:hypothetical protein